MDRIETRAYAKINIALDITRKREDGYHDMKMIMQSVSLSDRIFIKKIPERKITLTANKPWLPVDNRNLIVKAAEYMLSAYDLPYGLSIDLEKNIPVAAGLGGGSSDCAQTLVAINRMFGLGLDKEALAVIGKRFGADVPFCVAGGTQYAEGIGDILSPLPKHPDADLLIVKPSISVSTAWAFSNFSLDEVQTHPDFNKLFSALAECNTLQIASNLGNVLETVTEKKHPIISDIKNAMRDAGAMGVLMSGSGPSVFGYFESRKHAENAAHSIGDRFPKIREIFPVKI